MEEADQLLRRLRFAVGSRLGGTTELVGLPAAAAELQPDDNADSLLHRTEGALRAASEEPDAAAAPRS